MCVCVHVFVSVCVCAYMQDAVNSTNFTQDVRSLSLVHLALYVEKTSLSLSSVLRSVNLFDSFCRKLKITNVSCYLRALSGRCDLENLPYLLSLSASP